MNFEVSFLHLHYLAIASRRNHKDQNVDDEEDSTDGQCNGQHHGCI